MRNKFRVEIIYCTKCNWLLRSAWMAQEILSTFDEELSEVALIPGIDGLFEIILDGDILWSLKSKGKFPEIKELKKLLRDKIAPEKSLGHTER